MGGDSSVSKLGHLLNNKATGAASQQSILQKQFIKKKNSQANLTEEQELDIE